MYELCLLLFLITTKNINYLPLTILNNSLCSWCLSSPGVNWEELVQSLFLPCVWCTEGSELAPLLWQLLKGEADLGVELELWLSEGVENTSGRTARAVGSVTSQLQEHNRNVYFSGNTGMKLILCCLALSTKLCLYLNLSPSSREVCYYLGK